MSIRRVKATSVCGRGNQRPSSQGIGMAEGGLRNPVKLSRHKRCAAKNGPAAIRLLVYGTDGLADWEIVELILQSSIVRRDTAILAQSLIAKFGSLGGVLSANVYELDAVAGIGRREVANLKAVQAAAVRLIKAKIQEGPLLHDWKRLEDYLTSVLSHESVEHLRVLFLNQKNALLGEQLHSRGTVDHVPVYPREVVKRALELNSSAIILAHNHPSGNPTPSGADIEMTIKIMGALNAVGIVLHDHIIVGTGAMVSFRRLRVLPFAHIDPDAPYHEVHRAGRSKGRPAA